MKKQIKVKGTAYKKYTDNKPEIKRDLGKCSEQKLHKDKKAHYQEIKMKSNSG